MPELKTIEINKTLLSEVFLENFNAFTMKTAPQKGDQVEPLCPAMTQEKFTEIVEKILINQIKNETYTDNDPAIQNQIDLKFGAGNQSKRL